MADITKSIPHRLEELFLDGTIEAVNVSAALSVTVPSITDPDIAKVDVTVTGVALGDSVLVADPTVALPTTARLLSAYVSAADTVTFVYGSEGGNVTGAAKTHSLIWLDRT